MKPAVLPNLLTRSGAHWKAKVKDAATVEIGTLDAALVWDGTRRSDLGRLAEQWVGGS